MSTVDYRTLLARALARIDALQAECAELRDGAGLGGGVAGGARPPLPQEPVAIIGLSCRFPGGATPEALWASLEARHDAIREMPADRLVGEWPEGVPRWAGLVDQDLTTFDAPFFGMSPREAERLDPQQRLLLEVAWEAFERAGRVPARLAGTRTGVFVAMSTNDYGLHLEHAETHDVYDVTGNMTAAAAGRLAHTFGLQGPVLTVDTVCSGSLVTVHLAAQSLRAGESDLAIAGGVNVLLAERTTHGLTRTSALSPDGRCRTFDAGANGFVRGEGCGLVVLKRLSDALRDGDEVWGVLRATAINHDGRSSGLTVPNVLSQEALLRAALAAAGLPAEAVGYVETHGTGTSLGDPLEIEALRSVYGAPRADGGRVWLGALKTNIGHLEAAAGVAGLVKALLALRHERLPANLHLRHLNPRIRLAGTPLAPLVEAVAWPRGGGRRVAAVSSFGLFGTNAHALVEEGPAPAAEAAPTAPDGLVPLAVSGHTPEALRAQAAQLREHLRATDVPLRDVAFTLATARTHFAHRAVVFPTDRADAVSRLDAVAEGRVYRGDVAGGATGRLAFLFTGQGSQEPGMGRELHAAFPVFREALDAACAVLDRDLDRPLRAVLFAEAGTPDAALLAETAYAQPALFALGVALARLWASWGVVPDAVFGHSVGEIAAAHVAGVLSLGDAARLVSARARHMQAIERRGAMVSVDASEDEVRAALADLPGVDIAGINGPRATVIAGDEAAVRAAVARFEDLDRATTRLKVRQAFHSAHFDATVAPLAEVARGLDLRPPSVPLVGGATGGWTDGTDPDAWGRQVREPVRFLDACRTLEADGVRVFVELGPRPVLAALGRRCVGSDSTFVASLDRGSEVDAIRRALASVHASGRDVDWGAVAASFGGRRCALPTYAFERRRHWYKAPGILGQGGGAPPQRPPHDDSNLSPSRDGAARAAPGGPSAEAALVARGIGTGAPETPLPAASAAAATPGPAPASWLRWTWRRGAPVRASGFARPGRWLVLADRQGLADGVERALDRAGAQVVRVEAATAEEPARGWHRVDPADPAGLVAMLEKVAPRGLRGVVYLWGLDAEPGADAAWRGAWSVADALAVVRSPAMPRLYVATRHGGGPGDAAPPQARFAGLADALVTRWPRQRCTWLDVGDPRSADEAGALVRELLGDTEEPRVALRGDTRYVGRLVRGAPVPRGDTHLAPGGDAYALARDGADWTPWALARRAPGAGEVEVTVEAFAPYAAGRLDTGRLDGGRLDGGSLHGAHGLLGVAGTVAAAGDGVALPVGARVFGVVRAAPGSHVTVAAGDVVDRGNLGAPEAAVSALGYTTARGVLGSSSPPAGLRWPQAGGGAPGGVDADDGAPARVLLLGEHATVRAVGALLAADAEVAGAAAGAVPATRVDTLPDGAAAYDLVVLAPDAAPPDAATVAGAVVVDLGAAPPLAGAAAWQRLDLDRAKGVPRAPELLVALAAGARAPLAAASMPFGARNAARAEATRLDGAPGAVLAPGAAPFGGAWLVTGSSPAAAAAGAAALAALGATAEVVNVGALATRGPADGLLHVEASRVPPEALGGRTAALAMVAGAPAPVVGAPVAGAHARVAEAPARRIVCTAFAADAAAGDPVGAALAAYVDALPDTLALHWGRMGASGAVDFDDLSEDARVDVLATMLRSSAAPGHWIEHAETVLAARSTAPAYAELFPGPARVASTLATDLLALPLPDAEVRLAARVAEHLGAILRSDAPIDPDAPVATLGVDSLSALELVNRLHAELGVRLPTQTLLEPHSTRTLSAEVLRRLRDSALPPEP